MMTMKHYDREGHRGNKKVRVIKGHDKGVEE